jgi:hypothetical protein
MNVKETPDAEDVIDDDQVIPGDENVDDKTANDAEPREQEENEVEREEHQEGIEQHESTEMMPPTTDVEDDDDSSELTSDEHTGTVVRRRRDGDAFLGEPGSTAGIKGQYVDDEGSSWDDDEYIGLIPMLCARCARLLKRSWSDQRSKHYVVVVNVILAVSSLL